MSTPGRNDPCYCGSGIKYKNCHRPLDTAAPVDRLRIAQESYLKSWTVNAASFDLQGCYTWMAELATRARPKLLLDIGCGEGRGVKAILQSPNALDLRVVAIDENMACLRATETQLVESGFQVELIDRTRTLTRQDGTHSYGHEPIDRSVQSQVILLQSDFLTDRELEPYLRSIGAFDAVTVWLVGSHFERKNCSDIAGLGISSSGQYRLRVQNKAYELADRILRPDGVLHTVDRGEVPESEQLREDFLAAHREQASVTSMKVLELDYLEYTEPEARMKVAMQATLGTSGRVADFSRKAMLSIRSAR